MKPPRAATLSDLDALARVAPRIYAAHFGDFWGDALPSYLDSQYAPSRLAAELAADSDVRWWLVESGAELVAFAKTCRGRPIPDSSGDIGLELEKLYVDPMHLGAGIGSALLDAIRLRALAQQARWLWLQVLDANRAARRLYERCGYRHCGDVRVESCGRVLALHVMRREP
jgi:diamine N-acetyltransferase